MKKPQKTKPAVPVKQQEVKTPATPTNPKQFWKLFAEADGNDERVGHLVSFGRSLLSEMMDPVRRWGEVARVLNFAGVADGEEDLWMALKEIDRDMLYARDSIIGAIGAASRIQTP